jgi:hypothetical protein
MSLLHDRQLQKCVIEYLITVNAVFLQVQRDFFNNLFKDILIYS